MPSRKYKSTAQATVLGGSMPSATSGVTGTMNVNSIASFPNSYPFTLVVAPDTISEEIVTVTGEPTGTIYPVIRGEDGTSAVSHTAGDDVRHMITARDLQEPQNHIWATTGVHGITGALAPIENPTFTGTVVLPSATSIGPVSSTEIDYLDGVTSSIQTQLNTKQPIVSGVSDTEIGYLDGVTSSIQTQLNQSNLVVQATNKTANYTIASGDQGSLIKLDSASGAITVTVPTDATFNFAIGTQINFIVVDRTNAINFAAASGASVFGSPGLNIRAQYSSATLVKIGNNTWVAVGDLTA